MNLHVRRLGETVPVNSRDPRGLRTCFYVNGELDSCEDDDEDYDDFDPSSPNQGQGTPKTPSDKPRDSGLSNLDLMKIRRDKYRDAIYRSATGGIPGEVVDCLAGRESGWDPGSDNGLGFKGMYQMGSLAWKDVNDITGARYDYKSNVFDPSIGTVYAAAYLEILLRRQVGGEKYAGGVFSEADISATLQAYNGSKIKQQYADQIMECAKQMKAGNLDAALAAIGKH
jgi:hypothetical protein